MNHKRMTPFNHGLIWFGAAISIAEILTGIGNIAKISLVTMAALFALSLLMSKLIFVILQRNQASHRFCIQGLVVIGFTAYRYLMHAHFETVLGLTLPVMLFTAVVARLAAFIPSRSSNPTA